jgi:hypothetical protein
MIRTHTYAYAHPQHIKIMKYLKCLALIWEPSWMGIYHLTHTTVLTYLVSTNYAPCKPSHTILSTMIQVRTTRSHPYAHPQHIKIVKHLLHVEHSCASHLGWVLYSLNHYTILFVAPREGPIILGNFQRLGQQD